MHCIGLYTFLETSKALTNRKRYPWAVQLCFLHFYTASLNQRCHSPRDYSPWFFFLMHKQSNPISISPAHYVFDSLPHRSGCCLFWRFRTSFLWLLQVLVFACLSISTNSIDRESEREGRASIWIGAVLSVWAANFYYGCWCLLFLGYVNA